MGNGMNKVMPGLYIGNYRDSKDYQQLDRHGITHIVSIHDSPRRFHPDKHYLCVIAADKPDQNLSQYFSVCNDFIHSARLKEGNVLIHCLAGMSRSVTVAVAYIMAVTPLSWKEALKVVRAGRSIANPNLGFQNQLQDFESSKLQEERRRLKERFPSLALESTDKEQCFIALDYYEELLESKGVCEGHCKFGKDCPTGICRTDSRGGIRPTRKSSISSKKQYNTSLSTSPSTSSQLSVRSMSGPGGAQSCPTSPRCSKALGQRQGSSTATRSLENPRAAGEYAAEIDLGEISELRRSSSIVSTFRPRSSPAGLYSYTGSAPPSIHGSRVDLSSGMTGGTGSAIYLGSSSGGSGGSASSSGTSGSSPGLSRRLSMRSTPKSSPRSTPESSPKASPKRSVPSKAAATTAAPASTSSSKKSTPGSGRSTTSSSANSTASINPCPKKEDKSNKLASKTTVPCSVSTDANTNPSTSSITETTTTTTTTTTTNKIVSGSTSHRVATTRTPSIVIDTTTATVITSSGANKEAAYGRANEKQDVTVKGTPNKDSGGIGGPGGMQGGTVSNNASSKPIAIASNGAPNRTVRKE
ncbi:serine-rich adhesin for platelets [Anopheles nili]|uniref:serine-rich adhesin for platelets n=1 Tax=Anopheles nili TaxID=185578 RepID=UPI00237AD7DA|nr:serine-rich adhesin for platelets [Anopheles nili]